MLAFLFEKAVQAQSSHRGRRSISSLGGGLLPVASETKLLPTPPVVPPAGPTPPTDPSNQTQSVPTAEPAPHVTPGGPQPPVPVVEEEVESEYDLSDDSSEDSSSDDSDSEYDPEDSPSRPRRGRGRSGGGVQRGSKEGCVLHVHKVKLAPPRKKRRNGSAASSQPSLGQGQERAADAPSAPKLEHQYDEIDALLSDNEHVPPPSLAAACRVDVTLPIAALEPLTKWTVPELKQVLRAHHLPLGGKKGNGVEDLDLSYGPRPSRPLPIGVCVCPLTSR